MSKLYFVIVLAFFQSLSVNAVSIKTAQECPPDSTKDLAIEVPEEGLPFCSEYKYTSCCDAEDTLKIKSTVESLMKPECPACFQMVSEWKCAECHPKSGEFYIASADCSHDTTLQLCTDYCEAMFEVCKDIPFSPDDKPFYINDVKGMTAEDFCEKFSGPETNCFRGTIPKERDDSCKCEDHKCHIKNKKAKKEKKNQRATNSECCILVSLWLTCCYIYWIWNLVEFKTLIASNV